MLLFAYPKDTVVKRQLNGGECQDNVTLFLPYLHSVFCFRHPHPLEVISILSGSSMILNRGGPKVSSILISMLLKRGAPHNVDQFSKIKFSQTSERPDQYPSLDRSQTFFIFFHEVQETMFISIASNCFLHFGINFKCLPFWGTWPLLL